VVDGCVDCVVAGCVACVVDGGGGANGFVACVVDGCVDCVVAGCVACVVDGCVDWVVAGCVACVVDGCVDCVVDGWVDWVVDGEVEDCVVDGCVSGHFFPMGLNLSQLTTITVARASNAHNSRYRTDIDHSDGSQRHKYGRVARRGAFTCRNRDADVLSVESVHADARRPLRGRRDV
jgi:hypothetical protein